MQTTDCSYSKLVNDFHMWYLPKSKMHIQSLYNTKVIKKSNYMVFRAHSHGQEEGDRERHRMKKKIMEKNKT